jgi:hypothetical protein
MFLVEETHRAIQILRRRRRNRCRRSLGDAALPAAPGALLRPRAERSDLAECLTPEKQAVMTG